MSVADKQVVSRMLVDAAQQLNEEQVEILLAQGANPNSMIGDQTLVCYLMNSMLANESFGSADEIARMLLKAGADVDRACVHWRGELVAPLLACFKADDLRVTEGCAIMLLHAGASLDPVYQAGIEPLTAAYQDDARTLPDRILQRGAALNRVVPGWDLPLHWLARHDPVPNVTIGVLLDAGADPLLASPVDGRTGVELLARANRQVFDRVMAQVPAEKRNAAFLAPVVATLTADLQGEHLVRMKDGAQKLWTLLDAGADIRGAAGVDSILHAVIRAFPNGGHGRNLMNALLDAGAEIDAADEQGDTALHVALRETMADSPYAGILLARGADSRRQDSKGFAPLLRAIKRGDIALVNAMLDSGVDATVVAPNGRTALQLARELLTIGSSHSKREEIEQLIARLQGAQPSTDQAAPH